MWAALLDRTGFTQHFQEASSSWSTFSGWHGWIVNYHLIFCNEPYQTSALSNIHPLLLSLRHFVMDILNGRKLLLISAHGIMCSHFHTQTRKLTIGNETTYNMYFSWITDKVFYDLLWDKRQDKGDISRFVKKENSFGRISLFSVSEVPME